MKKSPSVIVISVLLVLVAIRLFSGHPAVPTTALRLLVIAGYGLAILTLMTAGALWRGTANALRLFGVWTIAYLAVFAIAQVFTGQASVSEAAVWCLFSGAILLAVGAHLRWVLRQAA